MNSEQLDTHLFVPVEDVVFCKCKCKYWRTQWRFMNVTDIYMMLFAVADQKKHSIFKSYSMFKNKWEYPDDLLNETLT